MAQKTVFITGCSSGFGKLAATTFAARGWKVVATMRTPERDDELRHLDNVRVAALDVTDPASIERAVNETLHELGAIDVLVNNAGVGGNSLFEQIEDRAIRAMFDTNVFGLMNVTRAVLPHMRRRKAGRIINVTSTIAVLGGPTVSVYAASKFAAQGFSESLAFEVAPLGIQVKTVMPGAFPSTRFNANSDNETGDGDAELEAHARRMGEALRGAVERSNPTGVVQDPQIVADKIVECATTDTPIHNPVGADAEALVNMMVGVPRQQFLDGVAAMLHPEGGSAA